MNKTKVSKQSDLNNETNENQVIYTESLFEKRSFPNQTI